MHRPPPPRDRGLRARARAIALVALLWTVAGVPALESPVLELPFQELSIQELSAQEPSVQDRSFQEPDPELTVERMFRSGEFFAQYPPDLSWTPDGREFTFVVPGREPGTTQLLAEDVRTGSRSVVVGGRELVPEGAEEPLAIEGYRFSPDARKLLLFTDTEYVWRERTRGVYWVFDLGTRRLAPLSEEPGLQQFAKFSPDGTRVGFVRNHDLFVRDLETGREVRLTDDGSETLFNGTFDWVYEEELGLQDGWRWSPDGTRIAYWQVDDAPVLEFAYDLEYMELYPEIVSVPYPKAGEDNPLVRIGVVDADGGPTTWMDGGGDPDVYLARMDWAASDDELVIQRLNRLQNRLDVLLADTETGELRTILTDESDTWVDVDLHFRWVDEGRRFVWSSERDGWQHLYLHERDGTLVRQLTEGEWDVTTPVTVDDRWAYFLAHRRGPVQTNLYRVPLAGGQVERVTPEDGTHEISMNPQATHFMDTRSTAAEPPTATVRRADGSALRTFLHNEGVAAALDSIGVTPPEFFTFTTSDGVDLNGWMIRPPDFDPSREHPVLMYVYQGPGSQTVVDGWTGLTYVWHQLMAERGYIVASVDGRGTGGRGRAFKDVVYGDLGRWETHDQLEAADYLASLDYVDPDRIGMYGSSYGGYTTLLAMMTGEGRIRAGVSRAPVTDWRLYDTIYTERYMGLPSGNPEGYERSAPLEHVAGLEGSLLLVHGTGDDNVHFQNSAQLVEALQAEGKQFDFMIYPNQPHALRGLAPNLHYFELMTRFFLEEL